MQAVRKASADRHPDSVDIDFGHSSRFSSKWSGSIRVNRSGRLGSRKLDRAEGVCGSFFDRLLTGRMGMSRNLKSKRKLEFFQGICCLGSRLSAGEKDDELS